MGNRHWLLPVGPSDQKGHRTHPSSTPTGSYLLHPPPTIREVKICYSILKFAHSGGEAIFDHSSCPTDTPLRRREEKSILGKWTSRTGQAGSSSSSSSSLGTSISREWMWICMPEEKKSFWKVLSSRLRQEKKIPGRKKLPDRKFSPWEKGWSAAS